MPAAFPAQDERKRGRRSLHSLGVGHSDPGMNKWISGEWVVAKSNARQRRILHYWFTILWFTFGLVLWLMLRNELWFVGFMSLYAIWITHLAGWAAETPVESEEELGVSAPAENTPTTTPAVASEAEH